MNTYTQKGEVLSVTAPYDVASGAGAKVGQIFGVAAATALSGAAVRLVTEGVFTLAKTSAQAWAVGDLIYWDNTLKVCTTTAGLNKRIGVATAVAANPSSTGSVRL